MNSFLVYAEMRLAQARADARRPDLRIQGAFPDAEVPRPPRTLRFEVWRRIIGE
jgi:hypothetical protein